MKMHQELLYHTPQSSFRTDSPRPESRYSYLLCCCLLHRYYLFHYLMNNLSGSVAFTNQKMYGHVHRPGSVSNSPWHGSRDMIWVADKIHQEVLQRKPEWEEISACNRLNARFEVLKQIVKSRSHPETYREIRKEIMSLGMPACAGKQLRIEYLALKAGVFKPLVRLYYFLTNDYIMNRRNEIETRQKN